MSQRQGILFVIAAPSGCGKTSLVRAILESEANLLVSISHTTRAPRPGEVEGRDYFFISEADFQEKVQANQFLEHAEVFGQHYGTSKHWVEDELAKGVDVLLEIDWQGAELVRKQFPDAVSLFILPPSHAVLERRLHKRAQDDANVIARRLSEARDEIAHHQAFDYLIVNDDFSLALAEFHAIILAERLKTPRQSRRYQTLIETLLAM